MSRIIIITVPPPPPPGFVATSTALLGGEPRTAKAFATRSAAIEYVRTLPSGDVTVILDNVVESFASTVEAITYLEG